MRNSHCRDSSEATRRTRFRPVAAKPLSRWMKVWLCAPRRSSVHKASFSSEKENSEDCLSSEEQGEVKKRETTQRSN
ncbi:hypothetical protein E5288_WYG013778 [Bos mutus]|uniref:Uncharacterized protein n=1 Tax=Bos mutus TaxID=72004 RepID=A0A6B0QTW6_9CETA|nr:hypothetical protein [Bos mutus]